MIFKKISNQICAWLLTGVDENKNERLFSETIAFRNRLKGTLFYGNIALLIIRSRFRKKIINCLEEIRKCRYILVNVFAET